MGGFHCRKWGSASRNHGMFCTGHLKGPRCEEHIVLYIWEWIEYMNKLYVYIYKIYIYTRYIYIGYIYIIYIWYIYIWYIYDILYIYIYIYDMIWYDMIRCDPMWYDIWSDLIPPDVRWYMIWFDLIWSDPMWYDIWYELIWSDVIWCDMIYDTIWSDMSVLFPRELPQKLSGSAAFNACHKLPSHEDPHRPWCHDVPWELDPPWINHMITLRKLVFDIVFRRTKKSCEHNGFLWGWGHDHEHRRCYSPLVMC